MKSKFKGKITRFERGDSDTKIHFDIKGRVDTRLVTAQEASLDAMLMVKNIVADTMKVGATLTITLSDEEEDEQV